MSNAIEPRRPVPPAPIHPMAALATIVLDNIFGILEIADPLLLVMTSVGVGVVGSLTTLFVQRYLAKDTLPGDWNGGGHSATGVGGPARMGETAGG